MIRDIRPQEGIYLPINILGVFTTKRIGQIKGLVGHSNQILLMLDWISSIIIQVQIGLT